jgi:hypothetical protein
MPSSEYLRIQADQCLQVARRCWAPGVADGLKTLAAAYLREAERLGSKSVPQQQQQIQTTNRQPARNDPRR